MFVKSIDASSYSKTGEKTFELLDEFVEYVGEANVVQVISDNGSNFMLAGKFLQAKRPHLYRTPCVAHRIDLMLEDIGKIPLVSRTLTRANDTVYILKAMGPLVRVLHLVDNERKPTMSYLYEAMDRANEAITSAFNGREEKYKDIFKIIDDIWECQLHHPLHAVGHFLNLRFFYDDPNIEFDSEVTSGHYACIEKLVSDQNVQVKIMDELSLYKKAEGLFGFSLAIKTRKMKAPAEWWSLYGSTAPNLQKLAIKILSLTCSASGCERNWSIHTKSWNKLEVQKLNDLVFVKYNQVLKARYDCKDTMDLIALEDIDDSHEWLLGTMGEGNDEVAENEGVFLSDDEGGGGLTWGSCS
ncbi:hypothetical protein Cni_G19539 [Canna indica]|uniref:Uncharacterized protein n=1 Tax=Canna indica TaxID=4628 RepID=A0AAQ3KLB4_9LILI|nr:hypothetical protein Cni_G19539 [Canna indica]